MKGSDDDVLLCLRECGVERQREQRCVRPFSLGELRALEAASDVGGMAMDRETIGKIVKLVKNSKKKVQASIQGDLVRISGKDRDTLQDVIALLRQQDFGIDMQFTNYRTN